MGWQAGEIELFTHALGFESFLGPQSPESDIWRAR